MAIGEFDIEPHSGRHGRRGMQRRAARVAHEGEAARQNAAVRKCRQQLRRRTNAVGAAVEQDADRARAARRKRGGDLGVAA